MASPASSALATPAFAPAPAAAAKLWRRRGLPVPASDTDFGYFGPESVVWKVVTHPMLPLAGAQTTLAFESGHKDIQAAMVNHDPLWVGGARGTAHAKMAASRYRRTVGVPIPLILGDTATADKISEHLRGFHNKMAGTIGPEGDFPGHSYTAGSPDSMLFAHVTIFHAFLRVYEGMAFNGFRAPRRLEPDERDRYFRELVPFGVLMGIPVEMVPDSVAAVREYYASIDANYFPIPGFEKMQMSAIFASLKPKSLRDARFAVGNFVYFVGSLTAVGVQPRKVRRIGGLSPALDPFFNGLRLAGYPAMFLLSIPAIGDRVARTIIGPDGAGMVHQARGYMRANGAAAR